MLSSASIYPTIPADDLNRAEAFYRDRLGLEPTIRLPGAYFYEIGVSRFLLFASTGAASGSHTQMGFRVADIDAEVAQLKARGLEFEEYSNTVDGVATNGPVRSAWFKDSEGNLLGIAQLPQ
jgi:catechol 2,3-dioxygenase-like lactoylglutathione lyase family enzyme